MDLRQWAITLTIIKYKNITVRALTSGEIKLTRKATSLLNGISEKKRPNNKYKGAPGGWGIPKVKAVAIHSPQSHIDTVGAIVSKYTMKEISSKIPASSRFHRLN
jgi:hypothetical protein